MVGEALFQLVFIVDVEVQTVREQPRMYRILRVTGTMPKDEA